jgi:hypothetical protein
MWPLDNSQEQRLRMVCVKYVDGIDHSISVMANEFEVSVLGTKKCRTTHCMHLSLAKAGK